MRPPLLPLLFISLCVALLFACEEEPTLPPAVDGGSSGDGGPELPLDGGAQEPFTLVPFERVRISSHSDQPNFQQADAPFDWGVDPKAKVTLVVDLESPCYPFEKWSQYPPAQGHNWPAPCDAFDRTFTFTVDGPEGSGDAPGFEVVRAITPFGGPLHLEVDLTDLANGLPGARRLRTRIETWSDGAGQVSGSDGSWWVSAKLEVEPGRPPSPVAKVIPLVQTHQTQTGKGGEVTFTLPPGTLETRLEYRVTGHGGGAPQGDAACIGPADEFCRRTHTLFVDGEEVSEFDPWRDDCDTLCTLATHVWSAPFTGGFEYCLENPCGAQASVRAPRANWCPGSLTPPHVLYPPALTAPGEHTFSWEVSKIGDGGVWAVSAWLIAYGVP